MAKKVKLKLDAYGIVHDALETGLRFALNRLEDVTNQTIPPEQRQAAMDPMLNEIMLALSGVVQWEKSG